MEFIQYHRVGELNGAKISECETEGWIIVSDIFSAYSDRRITLVYNALYSCTWNLAYIHTIYTNLSGGNLIHLMWRRELLFCDHCLHPFTQRIRGIGQHGTFKLILHGKHQIKFAIHILTILKLQIVYVDSLMWRKVDRQRRLVR